MGQPSSPSPGRRACAAIRACPGAPCPAPAPGPPHLHTQWQTLSPPWPRSVHSVSSAARRGPRASQQAAPNPGRSNATALRIARDTEAALKGAAKGGQGLPALTIANAAGAAPRCRLPRAQARSAFCRSSASRCWSSLSASLGLHTTCGASATGPGWSWTNESSAALHTTCSKSKRERQRSWTTLATTPGTTPVCVPAGTATRLLMLSHHRDAATCGRGGARHGHVASASLQSRGGHVEERAPAPRRRSRCAGCPPPPGRLRRTHKTRSSQPLLGATTRLRQEQERPSRRPQRHFSALSPLSSPTVRAITCHCKPQPRDAPASSAPSGVPSRANAAAAPISSPSPPRPTCHAAKEQMHRQPRALLTRKPAALPTGRTRPSDAAPTAPPPNPSPTLALAHLADEVGRRPPRRVLGAHLSRTRTTTTSTSTTLPPSRRHRWPTPAFGGMLDAPRAVRVRRRVGTRTARTCWPAASARE